MSNFSNIEKAVTVLLKESCVRLEIEREGVWFRVYNLPGMLRFVFELTSRSLQVGFYDLWNGDVVKDEVWKFNVQPEGKIKPTDYFCDTTPDFKFSRFVLDEDSSTLFDMGTGKQWDAGRIVAKRHGILSRLADFDSVFHMKYEPMLRRGAREDTSDGKS